MKAGIIHNGDCVEVMRTLPDCSVDAVVCDPPYELGFMGKSWDASGIAYQVSTWAEAFRVLKPGGYLLAFGGSRTYHRMACAVEDAGFEIRDQIMWLYGSGFPKSHDVSKAIDKLDAVDERRRRDLQFTAWMRGTGITAAQINEATGTCMGSHYLTDKEQPAVATLDMFDKMKHLLPPAPPEIWAAMNQRTIESKQFAEREVIGTEIRPDGRQFAEGCSGFARGEVDITTPATPDAIKWDGWGTALKPAHEPIVVARKPFRGTVAANVLEHGTGALNIGACRVEPTGKRLGGGGESRATFAGKEGWGRPWMDNAEQAEAHAAKVRANVDVATSAGRWPANIILDPEAGRLLDEQSGVRTSGGADGHRRADTGDTWDKTSCGLRNDHTTTGGLPASTGGASRFFYCAKASRKERNAGLEGMPEQSKAFDAIGFDETKRGRQPRTTTTANHHPTVKPLSLMRYLCRLVTPPGGTILDPFTGSGSTCCAAVLEGFNYIGIDQDAEYCEIARRRVAHWSRQQRGLFTQQAPDRGAAECDQP